MPVTVFEMWKNAHTENQSIAIAEFFATIEDSILESTFTDSDGTTRTFVDAESAQKYVDFMKAFNPVELKIK